MHIMSIVCSLADAVSSSSWPILFKVLTLNVAICIVCLHFSSFCCLSSVADFSNTEARAPTSAGHASFLPARRAMRFMYVVWVWVMFIFRWPFLFSSIEATLIVPRSKRRSRALSHETYVQDQVRYCVWPSEGLFAYLYIQHAASHVYEKKNISFPVSFNLVKVQD